MAYSKDYKMEKSMKMSKFSSKEHGFSQDFRIGCPKIHIWGELGVQFLFIPLHYTHKIWILGCPKSTIGCPKDTPLAKGPVGNWPLVESLTRQLVFPPLCLYSDLCFLIFLQFLDQFFSNHLYFFL